MILNSEQHTKTNVQSVIFLMILLFLTTTNLVAQNFWQKVPLYGGGVNSISINQTGVIYGTGITGISKSTDNGDSWQQINNGLELPSINALAVTPNGYIFIAMRNLFESQTDTTSIYRSIDDGNSWTKVYTCQVGEDIIDFAVTPNGYIFVSIFNENFYEGRILKSMDDGITWGNVSIPSLYGKVECLEANLSGFVYAGAEEGVFRSTDYGSNWTNVAVNFGVYGVQAMGISIQGQLFAGTWAGSIWFSSDNGDSWTTIYTGNYDSEIATITINTNNYIFVGFNYTNSENDSSYILRSSDNGSTWPLNYSISNSKINCIAFNGSGHLFFGSDRSIYRSNDNGTTWNEVINNLTNFAPGHFVTNSLGHTFMDSYGLPLTYTTDNGESWASYDNLNHIWTQGVAINSNDHIFVGTEHGIFRSVDYGSSWTSVFPDTTWLMGIAINSKDEIFIGTYNETYNDGVFRSSDNGQTWIPANNGLVYSEGIRTFVFDANGYVYAGSDSGGVFRSMDNGNNWTAVNNGLPEQSIFGLAIDSSGNLFAGTIEDLGLTSGGLYRSTDGGQNWQQLTNGLPGSGVSSVVINSQGHIYISTMTDGVYRSLEGGNSWSAVNSGFPNQGVWSLAINNEGYIYAGRMDGVYRTIQTTTASHTVDVVPDPAPTTGKDLIITVTPSENFLPTSRILYYRYSGESDWRQIEMETGGETLNFTIPSDSVTYRGIEYYIQLSDGSNVVTYPPTDPQTNPAKVQVTVERQVVPLNFSSLTYKMVSIPILLNNSEIDNVLADDYNNYDTKYWRVLRYQTHNDSAGYFEHTRTDSFNTQGIDSTFTPGNAFWLITRSGVSFDVENGLSVNATDPFYYTLQPGWNQVGNPFPFPVAVDNISNFELLDPLIYHDGSEYQYDQTVTVLTPWEGYFVYNTSVDPVTISIPPVEATTNTRPKIKSKLQTISDDGYVLQLSSKLKDTKLVDTQNFLGFSSLATDEKDKFDLFEAPPIGDYLQVSIMNEKDRFASNFKSVSDQGQQWDVEIRLSEYIDKPIEFNLIEWGVIPEDFKLFILDKDYFSAIPVNNNKFTIEINQEFPIRHLKLIIGTDQYASQNNGEIPLVPVEYSLKQNYPNPFNSGTIIQYQLGKRTPVELSVFDILGRKVRTLISAKQTTGFHSIHWDGLNDFGTQVASGVYFYQLNAGNFLETKKLLLVR
jgi:photosystem II stability/assembly factor-like uncharacterized protein